MSQATRPARPAAPRPRTGRAAPLSPPERREAIVTAAIPLLRTRGLAVTTREIALAAGVAEGTLFNVFGDKETLIEAAVEAALDPGPTAERLEAIDVDLPLRERLLEAVRILQARVAETWQLVLAVDAGTRRPRRQPARASTDAANRHVAALEPLFAPEAAALRHPPADAARALFAITVGCSHPGVLDAPMPPEQVVDLLLDGVRKESR